MRTTETFRLTRRPRLLVAAAGAWLLLAVFHIAQEEMIAWHAVHHLIRPVIAGVYLVDAVIWTATTLLIFLLLDALPVRDITWPLALFVVAPMAVAIAIIAVRLEVLFRHAVTGPLHLMSNADAVERGYLWRFHPALLDTFAVAAVAYALRRQYWFESRELRAMQLELQLAQAQMQALRSQMQSHFLFNTLHSISVLLRTDPGKASQMLDNLGEVLRMAIDDSELQLVSLRSEVELSRRYLAIQDIRFGERLRVDWRLDPDTLDTPVPAFLLQPLIENSIKHGCEGVHGPLTVHIESERTAGALLIRVADNGRGTPFDPDLRRPGMGLGNLRTRLRSLFGDEATISLLRPDGGGTVVTVTIPMAAHSSLPERPAPAKALVGA
jgi:two-component system LytT family sensor kinase